MRCDAIRIVKVDATNKQHTLLSQLGGVIKVGDTAKLIRSNEAEIHSNIQKKTQTDS